MRPSLLVMGAFAHARLLEYVVGGAAGAKLSPKWRLAIGYTIEHTCRSTHIFEQI